VRNLPDQTRVPDLNALEAVTLAVCEREWRVAEMVAARHRASRGGSNEGARDPITSLMLALIAIGHAANSPYGAIACSRESLWRSAPRPKVLLLDEPAAGLPRYERQGTVRGDSTSRATSRYVHRHDIIFVFRLSTASS